MRRACTRLACAVLFVMLLPVAAGYAQDDPPTGDAAPAEDATEEEPAQDSVPKSRSRVITTMTDIPDRELTRSEVLEIIETLRREFEELDVATQDAALTPEAQARMLTIARELSILYNKLDALDNQRADEEDKSFGAKMQRLWYALQDASRYDVGDGQFRIDVGVRFQTDLTLATADDELEATVGEFDNSTQWRRFRVFARGRLFRTMDFKFEGDFAVDKGIKDAFVQGQVFKFSRWRLGRFKEPFSIGRQMSSFNAGFMEWALPVGALTPGRGFGGMLSNVAERTRYTWAAAATINTQLVDNEEDPADASLALTGRVTGLPVFEDNGRHLLHFGASYSVRNPKKDNVQYFTRPEARFLPVMASTPEIEADRVDLVGLEMAAVSNAVWGKAEWVQSSLSASAEGDPTFAGAYLQGGWYLSGESRFYNTTNGTFARTRPNKLYSGGNPFDYKTNGGALELTGRVSSIDLTSGTVTGGEVRDLSLGLNWYPYQELRVMTNYVHSTLRDVGSADILLIRFQYNP